MSKPLRMHQIRRIIELQMEGRSIRKTVELTGLSRNTVREYVRRMSSSGMSLGELHSLDDESLSSLVYVDASEKVSAGRTIDKRHENLKVQLASYNEELKKRGVTRQLLWASYEF